MKLEPVAWQFRHLFDGRPQRWQPMDKGQFDDPTLKQTVDFEKRELYAIPDGYVVVPVAQIKEARRIVAKAYADGNSASIRHYNCMTALDRLVDWKEGEECILPDEPIKVMILEGDGMKRDLKKLLAAKEQQ